MCTRNNTFLVNVICSTMECKLKASPLQHNFWCETTSWSSLSREKPSVQASDTGTEQGDIIPLKSEGAAAGITSAWDALSRTVTPLFDTLPIKVLALKPERTDADREDQGVSPVCLLEFSEQAFPAGRLVRSGPGGWSTVKFSLLPHANSNGIQKSRELLQDIQHEPWVMFRFRIAMLRGTLFPLHFGLLRYFCWLHCAFARSSFH